MKKLAALVIPFVVLAACSDAFDTHPYDVDIHGQTGINARKTAI